MESGCGDSLRHFMIFHIFEIQLIDCTEAHVVQYSILGDAIVEHDLEVLILGYLQHMGPMDVLVASNDLGVSPRKTRRVLNLMVDKGLIKENEDVSDQVFSPKNNSPDF